LGPTTQVIPGSKRRVVDEAKDLKPFNVRLFKCMGKNLTGESALDESVEPAARRFPAVDDEPDLARSPRRAEQLEEPLEGSALALGDDEDPSVGVIGRVTDQTEFERACSCPPTESDALDASVDPRGQPLRCLGHDLPTRPV